MERETEKRQTGTYEKMLLLVQKYLVQIVIASLGYAVFQLSMRIESLHAEMQTFLQQRIIEIDQEKKEWRDAYLKSQETYLLTVQKQQRDAASESMENRHGK